MNNDSHGNIIADLAHITVECEVQVALLQTIVLLVVGHRLQQR
jgi:hypothetical protein